MARLIFCVLAVLVVIFAVFYPQLNVKQAPVIITKSGGVQGRVGYTRNDKEYFEYLSIPYAQPPVGNLRFEPPVPIQPWEGIKQVTAYPPTCAQMDGTLSGIIEGIEDCLYLNVFTPLDFEAKEKKPVMVYIHGGAFAAGNTEHYRPKFFMDEDIVLVSMQYRLGPLGFLNTGDNIVRGNMGLKDQNLAMHWVQDNIDKFGGDPNKVTLFGQSAGGASVHNHIISKASKGLFQRAIAQSGAAICPWGFMKRPAELAIKYGRLVGCPTDNTSVMVECMRNMNSLEFVKPQLLQLNPLGKMELFGPSVEAVVRDDTFLSESPIVSLKSGRFSKVPLLTGVTSGDGAWRSARFDEMHDLISEMDKNWEDNAEHVLFIKTSSKDFQKIRNFYFGTNSFSGKSKEFMQNLTDMCSDALFIEPVRTSAILHAKHGAPTYMYYYDYRNEIPVGTYSIFKAVKSEGWIPAVLKIFHSIFADFIKTKIFGGDGHQPYGVSHGDDALQLWSPKCLHNVFFGCLYKWNN